MTRTTPRRFGWVPDVPDTRDFLYKSIRPKLRLPQEVDLRAGCSIVEDQGQLGSCTANALAGNIEYLDKSSDNTYTDVSRLFIYYNERVLRDTVNTDSGAALRDGIKTLATDGVCAETSWPYVIKDFTRKPLTKCYTEALNHKIESYHRIEVLNDALTCLADGFPFVFGFSVYESFMTQAVARSGIMPVPKKTERLLGGHAVLAVGYNMTKKQLLVRNSWGSAWGQAGCFMMPFAAVETLARDFWTIRK